MPFIRSLVSTYYTLLAASILPNSEIMSPYSYCARKGLVYIIIAALFRWQPSSYSKYTKANTCFSYNIHLVLINKYTFLFFSAMSTFLAHPNS